ncbi:MAG: cytochrome b/b6 domain-containing protein [Gammaproteobacteria bacterium]|nr:cytochrome b/b6 domain-containing protein [Gammaproteobacteria bacterium]MBU1968264.1 cytochrome b/b6 domain-containing protein [Gammaproteobacteria bacterium]
MSEGIRVWDVPTRVFHWTLVLSFCGAFLTSESERYRDIHVMLGYTILGLIVFRLLWGFIGTRYARFDSFLFTPGEVLGYVSDMVKGKARHFVGHNPAGSVSIWLLLLLAAGSGVSGVLLFQDIGGDAMEELHEVLSFGMLAVVAVHVAGVVVSSILHRENLLRAMITGTKSSEREQGAERSYIWLGVIMLAVVVAFWAGYPAFSATPSGAVATHAGHHDDDDDD